MTMFLWALVVLLLASLVFVDAVRPRRAALSLFELRRRQGLKDKRASDMLEREKLLAQASVLKTPLRALLLVGLALLLVHLAGWRDGTLAALAVGLLYGRVSRLSPVRNIANRLYRRNEPRLLTFVYRQKKKIRLLGGKASLHDEIRPVGSREELAHLLAHSDIFSSDEERLLESVLRFKDLKVGDVMTPEKAMVTVKHTEVLGPLVLDDLHKTGRTIFPVVKGRDVVGLLDSSDHVALRSKESPRVRDVMNADITKIGHEESLDTALKMFIGSRQQLLIVTGDEDQVVGLISLGDVIKALTGRTYR